jgi:hypothetical protein
MRISRNALVAVALAGAAVGAMVVVEARNPTADPARPAAGTGDVPVLLGTAPVAAGRSLMRPAPGAPIRIVPVLDWNVKATTPLLEGRDCLSAPATCHNGRNGVDIVYAAPTDIPVAPVRATVLSDAGCEPDAHGASHCLNRLRTASGTVINVRNDHRLANEPCLAAGEHVVLAPGATAAAGLARLRALAADRGGAWPSNAGMVTGACSVSDAGLKRAGITRAQLGCSRPAS